MKCVAPIFAIAGVGLVPACSSGPDEISCSSDEGTHWDVARLPRSLEVFDSSQSESRAHFDGDDVWFWTGKGAVRWGPETDSWEEVDAFDGHETFLDPFVRVIRKRLLVWGDRNAYDDPANDDPPARLEGFVYSGGAWQPTSPAPAELSSRFWGAVSDENALFVFTHRGAGPLEVGIYDVESDSWRHVETPFASEELPTLLFDVDVRRTWASVSGKIALTGKTAIWFLDTQSLEWSSVPIPPSTEYFQWLTATDGRLFAWDFRRSLAFEVLLEPLALQQLDMPSRLGGRALEAGSRVVIGPSFSSETQGKPWTVFDPETESFVPVGTTCEPELAAMSSFTLMTDYGLFVSGEVDWGDGPTYDLGVFPKNASWLVFPDSKPLK